MESREYWQSLLTSAEKHLGYSDGFKLLYCPWSLITSADTLFLSSNPGNDPTNREMRIASDEEGNSYLKPRKERHSPIAKQYHLLCESFGLDPQNVLTGTLMPFRTPRWDNRRDRPNIAFARPFWKEILTNRQINRVFCMGREVENEVCAITNARLDLEIPSGWGNYKIRRHIFDGDKRIYGLLHFSTFKLMSNQSCIDQLARLFDGDLSLHAPAI